MTCQNFERTTIVAMPNVNSRIFASTRDKNLWDSRTLQNIQKEALTKYALNVEGRRPSILRKVGENFWESFTVTAFRNHAQKHTIC
jgi:hypothetical protein